VAVRTSADGGTGGMAYRFLLEVPQTLAEAASIVVDQTGDSQVVVSRSSHGLGVDDPFVDMTVASHSLRIIDDLFTWYEALPPPRPDVRIVLHGGERHAMAEMDRRRMVALIRRDQPWVERSIPHIGDHEPSSERAGQTVGPGAPVENGRSAATAVAIAEAAVAMEEPAVRGPRIQAINYVLVQVNDLQKAELFYQDFFGMEILGRMRRGPDGTQIPLPRDYSWARAMENGELAETTFFKNGPLTLAAQRVGLGVLLGNGALEMVSIGVDARTFAKLKGEALMRPLTIIRSSVASFVFRDPLNVNWEIAVVGSVPLVPA
jgi:catechol 2,3-dioxygenase-like lactoylglutathione lyase family enzyme